MIDDLALRIKCGACALSGIVDAMTEGPNDPCNYIDGLHFISSALIELSERLYREVNGKAPAS